MTNSDSDARPDEPTQQSGPAFDSPTFHLGVLDDLVYEADTFRSTASSKNWAT